MIFMLTFTFGLALTICCTWWNKNILMVIAFFLSNKFFFYYLMIYHFFSRFYCLEIAFISFCLFLFHFDNVWSLTYDFPNDKLKAKKTTKKYCCSTLGYCSLDRRLNEQTAGNNWMEPKSNLWERNLQRHTYRNIIRLNAHFFFPIDCMCLDEFNNEKQFFFFPNIRLSFVAHFNWCLLFLFLIFRFSFADRSREVIFRCTIY